MPVNPKIQEPILVRNPITGRFVNVAPLFNTISEFSEQKSGSPSAAKTAVSNAIRFVNLSSDGDEADRKNVSFDLYQLEDMFGALVEYNQ